MELNWTPATGKPYAASCVTEKTIPVADLAALSAETGKVNADELAGCPPRTVLAAMVVVKHLDNGNCVVALRLEKFAEGVAKQREASDFDAVERFLEA